MGFDDGIPTYLWAYLIQACDCRKTKITSLPYLDWQQRLFDQRELCPSYKPKLRIHQSIKRAVIFRAFPRPTFYTIDRAIQPHAQQMSSNNPPSSAVASGSGNDEQQPKSRGARTLDAVGGKASEIMLGSPRSIICKGVGKQG